MQTQTKMDSREMTARHVALLESLARVHKHVLGLVVPSWMAGKRQKFGGLRAIRGCDQFRRPVARPVAVALEVLPDGSLPFSGAVSRPKNGKMRYDVILRYDLTRPMVAGGCGATISTDNDVLARRALGLLERLVRFGEHAARAPRQARTEVFLHPQLMIPFAPGSEQIDEAKLTELCEGMAPELFESYRARLRQDLCDWTSLPGAVLVNSAIVLDEAISEAVDAEVGFEDYSPVLGVSTTNPVVALTNPAREVLKRRGVTNVAALPQAEVDELVAEFRAQSFLGDKLTLEEVYDALLNPWAPALGSEGFGRLADEVLLVAMRKKARGLAAEATDGDMLRAIKNPKKPLVVSRMAKTQVVAVDDLQLPHPYVGNFLPPLDWEPPMRAARRAA